MPEAGLLVVHVAVVPGAAANVATEIECQPTYRFPDDQGNASDASELNAASPDPPFEKPLLVVVVDVELSF